MAPSRLYKYRRIDEHSEAFFLNNSIFFASPADFNDPFEGHIYPDTKGTEEDYQKFLTRMAHLRGISTEPDLSRWVRDNLAKFRDDTTRDKWLRVTQASVVERLAVYCLAETNDDILMWSHYSDGHRGFCLEFDCSDKTSLFGEARPVKYSDMYPVYNLFSGAPVDKFDAFLLTKSKRWEYEAEWRVVDIQSDGWTRRPGEYQYPPELLTGIIFGCLMSDGDKSTVRGWIEGRAKPVQLYQSNRKDRCFGLDIEPIH